MEPLHLPSDIHENGDWRDDIGSAIDAIADSWRDNNAQAHDIYILRRAGDDRPVKVEVMVSIATDMED